MPVFQVMLPCAIGTLNRYAIVKKIEPHMNLTWLSPSLCARSGNIKKLEEGIFPADLGRKKPITALLSHKVLPITRFLWTASDVRRKTESWLTLDTLGVGFTSVLSSLAFQLRLVSRARHNNEPFIQYRQNYDNLSSYKVMYEVQVNPVTSNTR